MSIPKPCGNFSGSYKEDEAIFKTGFVKWSLVLFILGLLFVPLVSSQFVLYVINLTLISIVAAHGLNLLTGNTGQISLGHGAFMGIGGYTAAILSGHGFSIGSALVCAAFFSAVAGLIFSTPSLRLKGFYLAMSTLSAQFLMEYLFMRLDWLTGGPNGLVVDCPSIFGLEFDTDAKFFYLALTFAVVATVATKNLLRTKPGRAFIAIKSKDYAAELMGINLFKYKTFAFMLSSAYAGISGALMVYYVSVITPNTFNLAVSIDFIVMIIIGGLGTVRGAVFGAMFVTIVPEVLKSSLDVIAKHVSILDSFPSAFPAMRMVIFGFIVILILVFEENGIAKMWTNIKSYWKLWPYSY